MKPMQFMLFIDSIGRKHRISWILIFVLFSGFHIGCATRSAVSATEDSQAQILWPAPPGQPRIKYVGSLKTEEDVTGQQKSTWRDTLLGKKKVSQGLLNKPYGVHSDSNGRIYVADTGKPGLVVFDLKNQKVSTWGNEGQGSIKKAVGVTSDSDGNVYVSDAFEKRVIKFDREGNFLDVIAGKEVIGSPAGLVYDDMSRQLFLVDVKKHQILVFNDAGELLFNLGERGNKDGQFNYPTNITLNASSRQLYVADSMNFRVQIFNIDGTFINAFGKNGNTPGNFSRLKGLGVDSRGHIYAVDAAFNNFQILNQNGELLLAVGKAGNKADGFYLPAGAHVDRNDRIYVADQLNQRIQIFQYLGDELNSHSDKLNEG